MRILIIGAALALAGCATPEENAQRQARSVCLASGLQITEPAYIACYQQQFVEARRIAVLQQNQSSAALSSLGASMVAAGTPPAQFYSAPPMANPIQRPITCNRMGYQTVCN